MLNFFKNAETAPNSKEEIIRFDPKVNLKDLEIKQFNPEHPLNELNRLNKLKKSNPALYLRLRWGFLGQGMNLPGKGGRSLSIAGYKIAQKFFGFN